MNKIRAIKLAFYRLRNNFGWTLLYYTHKFLASMRLVCQGAGGRVCFRSGKLQRQYTMYQDDTKNWVYMCDGCAYANEEYWQERWDEYNSGRL